MAGLKGLPERVPRLDMRAAPPQAKKPDQFYTQDRWRTLAAMVRKMRGNRCEKCGGNDRLIVDHVVERRDGGAEYDPENLKVLCQDCHNRKTAVQRKARMREGV